MAWIRQLITYAITIGMIIALVTILPRFARLRVHPDYDDIEHLETDRSLTADRGFPFARLAAGDPIAYRLGAQDDRDGQRKDSLCVGWVAAVPGDTVAIRGGRVLVDGKPAGHGALTTVPDRAPVIVPTGCVYILSDRHQFDSLARGFLPAAGYRAKLDSLP